MSKLSREELNFKSKPQLIEDIKKLGLSGYSGLNKPELIEYILNPPPKESQRSPGRPKGIGGSKLVTPRQTTVPWTVDTFKLINLIDLKKILVSLDVKGYSGKSKDEVITKLLTLNPPAGFSVQLEGGLVMFGSNPGGQAPAPSTIPVPTASTVILPKIMTLGPINPLNPFTPIPLAPGSTVMPMPLGAMPSLTTVPMPLAPTSTVMPMPLRAMPSLAPASTVMPMSLGAMPSLTTVMSMPLGAMPSLTIAPKPSIMVQPSVSVMPLFPVSTKKVKQVPFVESQSTDFVIDEVNYDIVQPSVGSVTFNNTSGITQVVIEIGTADMGYVDKMVLIEAIKLDKSTTPKIVFYDENSPKITMYLRLTDQIGWVTASGQVFNLTWNASNF